MGRGVEHRVGNFRSRFSSQASTFFIASWTYLLELMAQASVPFGSLAFEILAPRYISGTAMEFGFIGKYLSTFSKIDFGSSEIASIVHIEEDVFVIVRTIWFGGSSHPNVGVRFT